MNTSLRAIALIATLFVPTVYAGTCHPIEVHQIKGIHQDRAVKGVLSRYRDLYFGRLQWGEESLYLSNRPHPDSQKTGLFDKTGAIGDWMIEAIESGSLTGFWNNIPMRLNLVPQFTTPLCDLGDDRGFTLGDRRFDSMPDEYNKYRFYKLAVVDDLNFDGYPDLQLRSDQDRWEWDEWETEHDKILFFDPAQNALNVEAKHYGQTLYSDPDTQLLYEQSRGATLFYHYESGRFERRHTVLPLQMPKAGRQNLTLYEGGGGESDYLGRAEAFDLYGRVLMYPFVERVQGRRNIRADSDFPETLVTNHHLPASNCAEYLEQIARHPIRPAAKERGVNPGFLTCDAVALLDNAHAGSTWDYPLDHDFTDALEKVDLRSFDSSLYLAAQAHPTLADMASRVQLQTSSKHTVMIEAEGWSYGLTLLASADTNGDGKREWIVQLTDRDTSDTPYDNSQILLLFSTDEGLLQATPLPHHASQTPILWQGQGSFEKLRAQSLQHIRERDEAAFKIAEEAYRAQTHCQPDERDLFSCTLQNRQILSLCSQLDKEKATLRFRYGLQDSGIELVRSRLRASRDKLEDILISEDGQKVLRHATLTFNHPHGRYELGHECARSHAIEPYLYLLITPVDQSRPQALACQTLTTPPRYEALLEVTGQSIGTPYCNGDQP